MPAPDPSTQDPADTGRYGAPRRLWRALDRHRPPGTDTVTRGWRSPLRGPWLTSVYGLALLVTLPLVVVTGLLDYAAYAPRFGQAFPTDVGWLRLPYFDWPTRPAWLFRLTQGLHVGLGIVIVPVVLAKLWSVIPKLFDWPPARSVAQVLERLSLLLLVGGILFQIATGLLNIQYAYVFGFDFYTAHYFGAWVFTAALVVHVVLKLPAWSRRCGPGRPAPSCVPPWPRPGRSRPTRTGSCRRGPALPPSAGAALSPWSAADRCCWPR